MERDWRRVVSLLNMKPHPVEGGYFAETYRSEEESCLRGAASEEGAVRSLGTAIYYLVASTCPMRLHRLSSDEIFHFYMGDPLEMLLLHPDGRGEQLLLGCDLDAGMRPQVLVPAGVWQGARLAPGGEYTLMGTTVTPGFEYGDCEMVGDAEALSVLYPDHRNLILSLA